MAFYPQRKARCSMVRTIYEFNKTCSKIVLVEQKGIHSGSSAPSDPCHGVQVCRYCLDMGVNYTAYSLNPSTSAIETHQQTC